VKSDSDENDSSSAHSVAGISAAADQKEARPARTHKEDRPRFNIDGIETKAESTQRSQPSGSGEHRASGRRRWRDSLSTPLGIGASIAAILSLIVAVVALIAQWPRSPSAPVTSLATTNTSAATHRTVSGSHSQGLTVNVVRQALLDSAELATIDSSLKQSDLQPSAAPSAVCKNDTTYPIYNPARWFNDGDALDMLEEIDSFPTQKSAQIAFSIDSKALPCTFHSVSNISSQIAGLCDEGYAVEDLVSHQGYLTAANYSGFLRCGRFVLALSLETPLDDTFDQVGKFALYAQIAVPKVQALPGG
jgi:hypothetical protein